MGAASIFRAGAVYIYLFISLVYLKFYTFPCFMYRVLSKDSISHLNVCNIGWKYDLQLVYGRSEMVGKE